MEGNRCCQSFPNWTAFVDHMRTHAVLSPPMKDEDKFLSRHGLRINPKKSKCFENEWPENVTDKNPAKLEKNSSSLNASFEMTSEALNHGEKDDFRSRSYREKKMCGQTYSELSIFSTPLKKERTRSVRKVFNASIYPHSLSKEEVNAVECLLMLSRVDANLKCDSAYKSSLPIGSEKKAQEFPSEVEDRRSKKPMVSSLERCNDHGDINRDSESGMSSSCNKKMYECTTCNKFFDSFQALGGHRSSHSKVRGESKKLTNGNRDSQTVKKSPENFGNHKCNLCPKSFPSGQALGGHKRLHKIAEHNSVAAAVVSSADSTASHPHPHPTPMEIGQKNSHNSVVAAVVSSADSTASHPHPAPMEIEQKISHNSVTAAVVSSADSTASHPHPAPMENEQKNSHNFVAAVVVSSADSTASHPHPAPMEIEENFFKVDSIDLNLPAADYDDWKGEAFAVNANGRRAATTNLGKFACRT